MTHINLNPLAIPGLLMAAIVMCGYTEHAPVCPRCRPTDELLDLVNIIEAPEECVRLVRWIEEGVGILDWGGGFFTVFPVCRCSRTLLADWFRKLLARDRDARAEVALLAFIDELNADLW
jgi:hypothetical protein